jgi:hypothetical protein
MSALSDLLLAEHPTPNEVCRWAASIVRRTLAIEAAEKSPEHGVPHIAGDDIHLDEIVDQRIDKPHGKKSGIGAGRNRSGHRNRS